MRVSEIYQSVQGEGPHTGEPTTFVRFGGCNMRCPGWPCDTLYAVDPKFNAEWARMNPGDIAGGIADFPRNICFTGGEPFMQKDEDLKKVAYSLWFRGHTLEAFTNGSFVFPEWRHDYDLKVIMDWKLPGSGEAETCLDVRRLNAGRLSIGDCIKFVVSSQEDLDFAYEEYSNMKDHLGPTYWVGAAWGKISNEEIVDYILTYNLPWNLNVQVHKYVWDPEKRGV